MKLTPKRSAALIAFVLAILLLIHAIAAFFTPDPISATPTITPEISADNPDHYLTFAADADIIVGRCTVVRWDVSANQGLWINGYPHDSAGSAKVCIGDFTRPQLYVIFDDETQYLQELAIESLIYTPSLALNLFAHSSLILLLLIAGAHFAGFALPRPIYATGHIIVRALNQANRLPTRALIVILLLIFVIYAALHLPLYGDLPLDTAVEEDYLTDLSLREVWQTGLRPITIPAFFQVFNNNGHHIEIFQWIFSPLAWGILAAALAFVLDHTALKIAGFTIVLLFSATRDMMYWHSTLYSESLSNALFAILMAAVLITLWLYRHHAPRLTAIRVQIMLSVGLFALTFLWSFTRDDNSYAVAGTGGVLLLVAAAEILIQRRGRKERREKIWKKLSIYMDELIVLFLNTCFVIGFIAYLWHAFKHTEQKALLYGILLVPVLLGSTTNIGMLLRISRKYQWQKRRHTETSDKNSTSDLSLRSSRPTTGRPLRLIILPLLLGITFPIMFLVQSHNADVGVRYRLPIVNVLAKRILIDSDKTAFFAERGMPTNDKVMMYAGVDKFAWSYGLDFSGFEGWIESDSKRVYMEYLLSQPWQSIKEPFENWDQLWLYDRDLISDWASPITIPAWQDAITDVIYGELWGLLLLSAAGLITAILVTAYTGLDYRYSVPIMFLLLTIPAAFLNWHADSFAIGRHSLMLAIRWRLAMWLFILFGLDRVLAREKSDV